MVSNASEDLPEPDTPVMTESELRGISRLIFFRLCWRAPRTVMLFNVIWEAAEPSCAQRSPAHSGQNTARVILNHNKRPCRGQGEANIYFAPDAEHAGIGSAPWSLVSQNGQLN